MQVLTCFRCYTVSGNHFSCSVEIILIFIMTLFWALPPPLWHPPVAIVPYYLYAIVEKFSVQVMPGHRNAPPPPTGQGWRKGSDHHMKRGFLQSNFSLNQKFRSAYPSVIWLLDIPAKLSRTNRGLRNSGYGTGGITAWDPAGPVTTGQIILDELVQIRQQPEVQRK